MTDPMLSWAVLEANVHSCISSFENDALEEQIHEFPITTDPGTCWLKNPVNAEGLVWLTTDMIA